MYGVQRNQWIMLRDSRLLAKQTIPAAVLSAPGFHWPCLHWRQVDLDPKCFDHAISSASVQHKRVVPLRLNTFGIDHPCGSTVFLPRKLRVDKRLISTG